MQLVGGVTVFKIWNLGKIKLYFYKTVPYVESYHVVIVRFYLICCIFAVIIAKCLGTNFFLDTL